MAVWNAEQQSMQFSIIHLIALTTVAALIAALARFGEMGWSIIPILVLPHLFLLPRFVDRKPCPWFLQIRYHLLAFIILLLFLSNGLLEPFGWWRFPFSMFVTFYFAPAILVVLHFIKRQTPDASNLELRSAQLIAIWLPATMITLSFLYNTI